MNENITKRKAEMQRLIDAGLVMPDPNANTEPDPGNE